MSDVPMISSASSIESALRMIEHDLAQFELAPDMQNSVQHRYAHLRQLADSLQKLGVDSEVIDQSVMEIFNAYKVQLMRNLERMGTA